VVAAFGFLTAAAGNRMAIIVAGGDKIARVPARPGHMGAMASVAAVFDTPRRSDAPADGATLADALQHVARTMPRRGQVVVASDFLDATDWKDHLGRLCARHQVIAVQVTDPRERELPDVGVLAVIDVETGRRVQVPTGDAKLRARYAAAAAQRHASIRTSILASGAEHLELSTSSDWLREIARFARTRRASTARTLPKGPLR
jgi:hypothetical protein